MAENYSAAIKGILSSLQSNCRSENSENNKKCRREMEERMIMNEVALSLDSQSHEWRAKRLPKIKECYDKCLYHGRYKIRECNTVCINGLIQDLWGRINLSEFEQIASKYS